jgi:hypothetical protein
LNAKRIFIAGVVALALLLSVFLYGSASAERRARFITAMNALKEAHLDLQKFGGFTNYFRDMNVYPCTNRFAINGTNCQCEFAVETEELKEHGLLTITTNAVFVWVDKKHDRVLLVTPQTFPPGL